MDLTSRPDAPPPSRTPSQPPVSVDIGEVVLHGFGRIDTGLLEAAFSAELERLLRSRGVPLAAGEGDTELDSLTGLPPLPATTSPDRLGVALARSVHAGLSGRGREGREERR